MATLLAQSSYYKNYSSIPVELKHFINGAYRIVFHCVQKKLRNEFNSEQKLNSSADMYFNTLFARVSHSLNGNKSSSGSSKLKRDSVYDSYLHDTSASSRKSSNKSHDYDRGGDREPASNYSQSHKKSSDQNEQKNSIFVKLNTTGGQEKESNTNNVNQNSIFVKYNSNNNNTTNKASNPSHPSISKTSTASNMFSTANSSRGYENNSEAKSSSNYHNSLSSNGGGTTNKVSPASSSNGTARKNTQSSKYCTVL